MGQFLSFCLGLHLGLTDTSKGVRALAWGELSGFVCNLTALMQGAGEESLDMFFTMVNPSETITRRNLDRAASLLSRRYLEQQNVRNSPALQCSLREV